MEVCDFRQYRIGLSGVVSVSSDKHSYHSESEMEVCEFRLGSTEDRVKRAHDIISYITYNTAAEAF
jgi:hypothetical protein